MQPQEQKNQENGEQQGTFWGRSADALADVAYRYRLFFRAVFGVFFALCLAVAAVILGIRYIVLPQVGAYKTEIEQLASESLGCPVSFAEIRASWHGFQPRIDLENVVVSDGQGHEVVRLEHVGAIVSWWSLPLMEVRLESLQIDRPDVQIMRDRQGYFYLAGIRLENDDSDDRSVGDWVLKQHEIVIRDGTVHWKDEFRNDQELNLEQVGFVMKNRGRRHRFRLVAVPDTGLADSLDIRGDLSHPRFAGHVSDFSEWKGELYVDAPGIRLDEWKRFADFPLEVQGGSGAVRAWLAMDGFSLSGVTADIEGNNIRLTTDAALPVLDVRRLSGRFSMERPKYYASAGNHGEKTVYTFAADRFSMETADGKTLHDTTFSVVYVPGQDRVPEELKVGIGRLDISELTAFLPYFPVGQEIRRRVESHHLAGRLSGVTVEWKKAAGVDPAYLVKGRFEGLTVMEKNGTDRVTSDGQTAFLPAHLGFANLTGSISANEYGGELALDSKNTVLVLPLYPVDAPQTVDELTARISWKRSVDNVLSVDVGQLSLMQDGMRMHVSGQYTNDLKDTANRYGTADLTAKVENLEIARVKKYIPLQTPVSLNEWLSGALKGGKVSEAEIRLQGALADFPYADASSEGVFSVRAQLVDGLLNFTPNTFAENGKRPLWPVIEKIRGEFRMNGSYLAIHADSAETNHAALENVDVIIADVLSDNPQLDIRGKASGTLQHLVGYVNLSPVTDWIGHLTEKTRATGNAKLGLEMHLPLEKLAASTVNGTLQFDNNDIVLLEDLPVISKTRGQLLFSEKGFRLEKIRGDFLYEPVTVSGGTQQGGRFLVRAEGILSAKGLQQTYNAGVMGKLVQNLSGNTPYNVTISDGLIRVESSLKGLKIGLPTPLGKQAGSTVPLSVQLKDLPAVGNSMRDELTVVYGDNMTARYLRQKEKRSVWRVMQGGIGINTKPVLQDGLSLGISMHSVDFNMWSGFLKNFYSLSGEKGGVSSGESALVQYVYPRYFSVDADKILALDMLLNNVRLNGVRQAGNWDFHIASNQINGQLKWQEATGKDISGKLIARLRSLNILQSSLKQASTEAGKENTYWIPSLDIVTDELTLFEKHLGKTEIVANNVSLRDGREWRINRLKITNPDAILDASGSWISVAGHRQQTRLHYVLNIKNAGKLLGRLGYDDLIKRGNGEMKGDLSWEGVPFALDLPSLSGKMSLKVQAGQFLKADPGAAKLLSVISLQSLPRRLSLDFRDIFAKGFAFDEITAHATIANGIMNTENLKMNGVNATVLMNGSVNIARESQNLHVVIIPEINAAAASIAYGFINPAIGVGTFLAQMFLRKPLMKQFTHEYSVTGSWKEPVIREVKSDPDKKADKTDSQRKEGI